MLQSYYGGQKDQKKVPKLDYSKPIVAIVGPTASGKSALAMALAQAHDGEIICADSRTVYAHMDIGTAKPTTLDRELVTHHCLDLVLPSQAFSAAEFKRHAQQAIQTIHRRGKLPIIVGGSGLYIDGLLYDYEFGAVVDPVVRARLEAMNLAELQTHARTFGIDELDTSFQNPRHLSRLIERQGNRPKARALPSNVLVLGVECENRVLAQRIEARVESMLANGFALEVQKVLAEYGVEAPALLAPGYKAFAQYNQGFISLDEAKELFIRNDKKLAKRQKTWFKRNKDIQWIQNEQQASHAIQDFINNL